MNENDFLLHALVLGVFITFVYDILRILRKVFPHREFFISLEDIGFWIYCAVKVFLLMYHESNGTLRWFAVLGALAGMLVYRRLISPWFVKYVSLVLGKLVGLLVKIGGFLFAPLRKAGKCAISVGHRTARIRSRGKALLKKKLTFLRKVLKMNL